MGFVVDTRAITAEKMGYTNKIALLEAIRKHPQASRLGLSSMIGLDPSTVSKIVSVLIERGLVRELGSRQALSPGRRSVMLSVVPEAVVVLVVSIGVETTKIGYGMLDASVEELEEIPTTQDVQHFFDELSGAIGRALSRPVACDARALVISIPGMIDVAGTFVLESANIGWHNVDVGHELRKRRPTLDQQIFVWNEANLTLIAETFLNPRLFGMKYGVSINLSHSIGGALWWEGKISLGAHNLAGEIWHMSVDRGGSQCRCGRRGCLNSYLSIGKIVSSYDKESSDPLAGSTVLEKVADFLVRAGEGEELASEALERALGHLAEGVAYTLNSLDPEFVILGGAGSYFGAQTLERIAEEVRKRVLAPMARDVTLLAGSLHLDRAAMIGGVLVGVESLLAEDLHDFNSKSA